MFNIYLKSFSLQRTNTVSEVKIVPLDVMTAHEGGREWSYSYSYNYMHS